MKELLIKIFGSKIYKRNLAHDYYSRGVIFGNDNNNPLAELFFLKAIKIDPKFADAYNGMASYCYFTNRFEEAEKYYLNAISLNPINAKFYSNLGSFYKMQLEIEKSEINLFKALKLEPKNIIAIDGLKELESVKNYILQIRTENNKLIEIVNLFDCPSKHEYITNDCPYCQNLLKKIAKIIDNIDSLWLQIIDIHFYTNEEFEKFINLFSIRNHRYILRKIISKLNNLDKIYENDFFHYPLQQWDEKKIEAIYKQMFYDCRGFMKSHPLKNANPVDVRNMLEGLHYTFKNYENTSIKNVFQFNFTHKVTYTNTSIYCQTEDIQLLNKVPFYFNLMPFGVEKDGVIIPMSIMNGVVKIYTNKITYGVKAEYTLMKQFFLNDQVVEQKKSIERIDNKRIVYDILKTNTDKEIIFDISDFYDKKLQL